MSTGNPAAITADPNDPAWREARRSFIGASDVPAILGLSPWRTPLDVWAEKVGLTDGGPSTLATQLGHELEDLIARLWSDRHPDADVQHAQQTQRHPDLSWLAASTDREVGTDGLLECKLVGGRQTDNWRDGVPLYVQAQCQTQLAVTGRQWVDVCSLHAGNGWEHRIERIDRDDTAILAMLPRLDEFWHAHVVTGVAPDLDGDPWRIRDTLNAIYPGSDDSQPVRLTAELVGQVADLKRAKALLRDLERDVKAAENTLCAALGDATDGFAGDNAKPVVTWRPQVRTGHDLKRLAAGDVEGFSPDEIATAQRVLAAVQTTTTHRVLRLA